MIIITFTFSKTACPWCFPWRSHWKRRTNWRKSNPASRYQDSYDDDDNDMNMMMTMMNLTICYIIVEIIVLRKAWWIFGNSIWRWLKSKFSSGTRKLGKRPESCGIYLKFGNCWMLKRFQPGNELCHLFLPQRNTKETQTQIQIW